MYMNRINHDNKDPIRNIEPHDEDHRFNCLDEVVQSQTSGSPVQADLSCHLGLEIWYDDKGVQTATTTTTILNCDRKKHLFHPAMKFPIRIRLIGSFLLKTAIE